MQINQMVERLVIIMPTDHQGAYAQHRSCPWWSVRSHRGSTAQPEAGLMDGKHRSGAESLSHLRSSAKDV